MNKVLVARLIALARLESNYPKCYLCHIPLNKETATVDYKVPLSKGGSNRWDNIALYCARCKNKKEIDYE